MSDKGAVPDFLVSNIADATPMHVEYRCENTLKRDFLISDTGHYLHATLRRSSLHQALLVPWETAHPQADWVHRPGCGSWKVRRYEKADHTVRDVVTWVVLEVMPHSHHAPGA